MSQLWGLLKNPTLFEKLVPSFASGLRCVSGQYAASSGGEGGKRSLKSKNNTRTMKNKIRKKEAYKKILVGKRFFAHVQTDPGAHPASCTIGTGSFLGVKWPGRGADHPPLLVPRSRKSRAIPLSTL
jgi:hypothetical protein